MNSIAGIVYPDVYRMTHQVAKMLTYVEHRVPLPARIIKDIYEHKNIELGICGKKIATIKSGDLLIGIDGYLINHRELAETLKKKGYPQDNQSAEHTILHAYEEWGPQFLEYLEGDFALFIYNQRENSLLLARDRIGKKPLYWAEDQGHFLFCSSLKGILATGIVAQTPENSSIAAYFYLGYFPQDMTPIKNINKLLPGHYLLLNQDGSKAITPYWSYSAQFKTPSQKHKNALSQQLNTLLNTATEKNIPKNPKNIGSFLTGGLGTSAVAYYLKNNIDDHQINGFTTCFKKETEQDYEAAREVSEILEIPLQTQILTEDNFLNDFVTIAWHLDEPISDPNVISYWTMAESAAKYSSEIFSGMGCDELLAGHSRYSVEEQQSGFLMRLQNNFRQFTTNYIVPFVNKIYHPWAYAILKRSRKNVWQSEYLRTNALLSVTELEEISPNLYHLFDPEVFLSKFYNISSIDSPIASYIYLDVKTRLPDQYMLEVERVTAAFAMQWHTPFLDKNVVEFSATIPIEQSLQESNTASTLKTIMKTMFPPSIVNRPKRRRNDFLKEWTENSDLHIIFTELTKGTLVEVGIIDDQWLAEAVRSPKTRKENFHYLWSILTLEVWFKLYINRPMSPIVPNITVRDLLQEN